MIPRPPSYPRLRTSSVPAGPQQPATGVTVVVLAALALGVTLSLSQTGDPPTPPGPVLQSPSTPVARSSAPARRTAAHGVDVIAGVVAKRYRVSSKPTREFIASAFREAGRHGLDPLLVVAVMAVESGFDPVAQSSAGAMGLMQVIPRFHQDKLDQRPGGSVLDPPTNIWLGTKVLHEYIRRAGNESAGLQLYNGAARDPTMAYANRVFGERRRLEQALASARAART